MKSVSLLAGLACLLVMSCLSKRTPMWYYGKADPLRDSIQVSAYLNDTVFDYSELQKSFAPDTQLFIDSSRSDVRIRLKKGADYLKWPLFSVTVTNISSLVLALPTRDLRTATAPINEPVLETPTPAEIVYSVGRFGTSAPFAKRLDGGRPDLTPRQDDAKYFGELQPKESLKVANMVNVFSGYPPRVLAPGEYWLVVQFRNYWWKGARVPVWTGQAVSDTLRFRITTDTLAVSPK